MSTPIITIKHAPIFPTMGRKMALRHIFSSFEQFFVSILMLIHVLNIINEKSGSLCSKINDKSLALRDIFLTKLIRNTTNLTLNI